ncbi:hypothetical protein SteCoe_9802 [Stentor coeruleus]|uniref:Uncharacterized protein n=1 Tax=Stentor coeruleus TaxID=5963 RepID=A0A1R2CH25_9CILI|nr:hypothetical protein SteCoe_9802 [Stentor coeruleus]
MELINQNFSHRGKKRSFIVSMNKYNPYRITSITESLYDKIILSRKTLKEPKIESPRNPKAIYLPPVRCEDNTVDTVNKTNQIQVEYPKEPFSVVDTKADGKIDNLQVLSKSLDFDEMVAQCRQDNNSCIKKKNRIKFDGKISDSRKFKRNFECNESYMRTMSSFQNREGLLKLPLKHRENRSPWAFQTKFFHIN